MAWLPSLSSQSIAIEGKELDSSSPHEAYSLSPHVWVPQVDGEAQASLPPSWPLQGHSGVESPVSSAC